MEPENNLPRRKHPAHFVPVRRHNTPIILHVTVCTNPRRSILANESTHTILRNVWIDSAAWKIGYYLIMPDHIHFFCAPASWNRPKLKNWVTYWRRTCSRQAPELKGIWQNDIWDTQMRDKEHYERKMAYVKQNPVRYGLVEHPENWPYQGRLWHLAWI